MTKEEAIQFAKAYALGVRDATWTTDDFCCTDLWYGLDEYDINVDGEMFHDGSSNQLRILIYRREDYSGPIHQEFI